MIASLFHLELHAARHAELVHAANQSRIVRAFRRDRTDTAVAPHGALSKRDADRAAHARGLGRMARRWRAPSVN